MKAKRKGRILRKLWMLPLSLLLLAAGAGCGYLLYTTMQFRLPAKPDAVQVINTPPVMDRECYVWVPPEEPEEEPEEEYIPDPYRLTIDLGRVQAWHEEYSDVVGWVRVPDTIINYPIMQTNNNSFYETHSSSGYPSGDGAIFEDWRCDLDNSDNSLVYGHNLASGAMFHAIKNYKVADWGKTHPFIEVASLSHRYLYKVLSVNVLYGLNGAKFEFWNYIDLNRGSFRSYVTNIRSTSQIWYGDAKKLPRDGRSKIIALQTCDSGAHDGMRCVVFAERIGDFCDIAEYDIRVGMPEEPEPPFRTRPY